jgi:error-prone DNA polymerase
VLASGEPFETLFAQAVWLKTWFGDRAALALPLLHRPHDALLLEIVQRVAALTGLPSWRWATC